MVRASLFIATFVIFFIISFQFINSGQPVRILRDIIWDMVKLKAFLRDPLKLKQVVAPVVWVLLIEALLVTQVSRVSLTLTDDFFWLSLKFSCLKFYSTQWWKDVELGPPDIILGIFEAFKVDQNPSKIDLSVGAYRDNYGKPYVLTSVLKAENRLVDQQKDKLSDSDIGSEYFREVTYRLAVGDKLFERPHVSVQVSKTSCVYVCRMKKNTKICNFIFSLTFLFSRSRA